MKLVTHCQSCESERLRHILSLGYMPPVNMMVPVDAEQSPQTWLPTDLLYCEDCQLVQLGIVADKEWVFPADYPYTSGTTKLLRDNFSDLARECYEMLILGKNDLVIDIGSNDGTLLSNFKERGQKVLGVEPTDVADIAVRNGIPTFKRFFDGNTAKAIRRQDGRAKLITMANCFAHIENPNAVVEAIKELMGPTSVFVSESHYLPSLLREMQYDTIYHEHLRYYSVKSLKTLLERHGLEIFHVKQIPTHGGSIRVYAAAEGVYPKQGSVREIMEREITIADDLRTFSEYVKEHKRALLGTIFNLKLAKKSVVGISAPSRASTLFSYLGLDESLIDYVCEIKGSLKIGRCMPGTRIPVVDEKRLYEEQPDVAIIFSWHIADEIRAKLRANGFKGKLIVPLPYPVELDMKQTIKVA